MDVEKGFFLNRVYIYALVLSGLTLDMRTTKFVLKEIPDMISLLGRAYLMTKEPDNCGKIPFCSTDPLALVRQAVIHALCPLLLWSKSASQKVGKSGSLLPYVIRDTLAVMDEDELVASSALRIVRQAVQYCDQEALLDDILTLTSRVLVRPMDKYVIENAIDVLRQLQNLRNIPSELAAKHGVLAGSLVGLAACDACDTLSRYSAGYRALLLSKKWRKTVFDLLPPGAQMTEELLHETLRSVSQSDKDVRKKVQQLKALYSKSTDEAEHHIFRRCSNAECEKVESKEKKFKVCAGCSLALFCSKGKPDQFEGVL
jgi:hypothetical protein